MSYQQPYMGNTNQANQFGNNGYQRNDMQSAKNPPPQYGQPPVQYGQPIQPPPTVVVINQNGSPGLGPQFCRVCNKITASRIQYQAGTGTWLICLGAVLLGFWLGCCLIPFCIDDLKDKKTYCGVCATLKHQKKLI